MKPLVILLLGLLIALVLYAADRLSILALVALVVIGGAALTLFGAWIGGRRG